MPFAEKKEKSKFILANNTNLLHKVRVGVKIMDRYKIAKRVSLSGLFGNLFLLIIKSIVGLFSNSHAMIADAMNSAGDILSSCLTYFGNKIASKPRDDFHNMGYGKAEYIFSIFIAISMIYLAMKLFISTIKVIFNGSSYNYSIFLVIVSGITILIKLLLFIYTNKVAKKTNNLLILANSIDHRNDFLLSIGTFIAVIMAKYQIYFVDSLVSIIITFWICLSGINIFVEAYRVLMDRAIDKESEKQVYKIIDKYPEVKKVNHFNSTAVGYQYQVNFTIFVDGEMSTFESHEIANKIEKELMKIPSISLAVIHVNPIKIKKGPDNSN